MPYWSLHSSHKGSRSYSGAYYNDVTSYQIGFSPYRWTNVPDIMLYKESGNSLCHRLCILALFKNDFNQSKRILVAHKVGYHVEDNDMESNMQHGSHPGKTAIAWYYKKVLSHNIVLAHLHKLCLYRKCCHWLL
jgi:hypothetical protein